MPGTKKNASQLTQHPQGRCHLLLLTAWKLSPLAHFGRILFRYFTVAENHAAARVPASFARVLARFNVTTVAGYFKNDAVPQDLELQQLLHKIDFNIFP